MQGYKEYKETGLNWLEKIPRHWQILKFNVVFIENKNINVNFSETCALQFKFGEIVPKKQFDITEEFEAILRKYTIVIPDNIIINGLNLNYDFLTQRVGLVRQNGVITSAYIALCVKDDFNPCYLNYLLKSMDSQKVFNGLGSGIRLTLDYAGLKKEKIPVPPREEQDKIVKFLDHKLEKTHKFIANKQKLIILLEEQKQAIINQAVTKGLDLNAPMKHSGIDWLGEVPKHWEVNTIKSLASITRGRFNHRPRNDVALYDNGQYPFIQTGDVANANMYIATYKQKLNELGCAVSKQFSAGTLVMTIAANIGDVAILNFDAYFPDSIVGFIPKKDINLHYLYYCFYSMKNEFLREAPVNTQANLNVQRIGGKSIPIPPYEEQEKIVLLLSEHTQKIEKIVKKTKKEIDLIQEYKTSLISAVVTGQVNVGSYIY